MPAQLAPNVELLPGYRLIRPLGRGGFGEVWEAEAPGGMHKAIKVAALQNANEALSNRELEGLQKVRGIRHPYLLSLERFEVVDGYLLIVSELADRSLTDRFNECVGKGRPGIPRNELLHYLREAAEVLDLMNKKHGLQHLDIKPDNLFLSGKHIKVADFGLVQPGNTQLSTTALAVSAPYASPELFEGKVEPTADQYSLAVTYQEMLTGRRPYQSSDVRGLLYEHLKSSPDLSSLPLGDRPILNRAYKKESRRRFSSCTEMTYALINAPDLGPAPVVGSQPRNGENTATTGTVAPLNMVATEAMSDSVFAALPGPDNRTQSIPLSTAEHRQASDIPRFRKVSGLEQVQATIMAYISMEEYADRLQRFIGDSKAEIVTASPEKTVVQFRSRGLLFKSSKALFLKLETSRQTLPNGHRSIDVTVWSSANHLQRDDLIARGGTVLRCIREYLTSTNGVPDILSDRKVRADIYGG